LNKKIDSILFVCTANSGRSPLAEYYFKKLLKENKIKSKVSSAGTDFYPVGISEYSLKLLKEDGIDAKRHKPKVINEKIINEFSLILCMDRSHIEKLKNRFPYAKDKIFLLSEFAVGSNEEIEDPIGKDFGEYKKTYEKIKLFIDKIFKNYLL